MAKVNTLLVIGNGFDLAHGMKTSYRDILNAIISYMAVGNQNIDFTSEEEFKAYDRNFDVDMIKKVFKAYNDQWQKNHSRKFWDLLEKHLPTAKVLRKELKRVVLAKM